ncbi:hypothetical protein N9D31_01645 [Oligoflexaceae bacterium]|nr:hypothetical protein [Oligoflexaceae bacterium]
MRSIKAFSLSRVLVIGLATGLSVCASQAKAIGNGYTAGFIQPPVNENQKQSVWHSPFQKNQSPSLLERKSFGLLRTGQISLDAVVSAFMNERSGLPGLKFIPKRRSGFSLQGVQDHKSYQLSFQGTPLCSGEVKATQFDSEPIITGSVPNILSGQSLNQADWPTLISARQTATRQFRAMQMNDAQYEGKTGSRCIFVDQGEIIPVWKMTFTHEGLPYHIWADGSDALNWQAAYFQADGNARAYEKNPNFPSSGSPSIVDLPLSGLTGDGFLTNAAITTEPFGVNRTESGALQFLKDPGEEGFAEINSFVHANKTLNWFESNGFNYTDEDRLNIRVHFVFSGGDINNAVYQPLLSGPVIQIADGGVENGQVRLENLSLDGDVVSHEFAHHVIFQSIQDVSAGSESLVLHEGLADAFTFLRTDDACLGESICPANSTFPCFEKGACLRSAENDFKFTDSDLPPGHHARGQFISGLIWDLKKSGKIPLDQLSEITVKAIDLMVSDSGYLHLILAMMTVDRELFNGQYGCDIYEAAEVRGLGEAIEDFSCNDSTLPTIDESTSEPIGVGDIDRASGSVSSAGADEGSKEKTLCGTVGSSQAANYWLWLLLIAPLCLAKTREKSKN